LIDVPDDRKGSDGERREGDARPPPRIAPFGGVHLDELPPDIGITDPWRR
jgi:hypothetical protein